jgi:hypothetical protein
LYSFFCSCFVNLHKLDDILSQVFLQNIFLNYIDSMSFLENSFENLQMELLFLQICTRYQKTLKILS